MSDLLAGEKTTQVIPAARSLDNSTIERVRFQHNRPRSFSSKNEPSVGVLGSNKLVDQDKQQPRAAAIVVTTTSNSKHQMNQQQTPQIQQPSRYKTELCRPFLEYNHCRYGDKCQFAHGKSDLRTPLRHPRYKTELCRTYHSQGYCPYGARCHFIHSTVEARPSPMVPANPQSGSSAGSSRTSGLPSSSVIRISTPSQHTAIPYSKPPLSPSQDSGISSPPDAGTPNSIKVFEYPLSDSNSDDFDPIINNATEWNPIDLQFPCDNQWDSSSTDSFSPMKTTMPPFYTTTQVDDLADHFSSTSLDEFIPKTSTKSSRLPVFDQLNSFSDTALLSNHHDNWW